MNARVPLSRAALIRILTAIQNAPTFAAQDILTFTGFMDDAEVGAHVWACFGRLDKAGKARVLGIARDMLAPAARAA